MPAFVRRFLLGRRPSTVFIPNGRASFFVDSSATNHYFRLFQLSYTSFRIIFWNVIQPRSQSRLSGGTGTFARGSNHACINNTWKTMVENFLRRRREYFFGGVFPPFCVPSGYGPDVITGKFRHLGDLALGTKLLLQLFKSGNGLFLSRLVG